MSDLPAPKKFYLDIKISLRDSQGGAIEYEVGQHGNSPAPLQDYLEWWCQRSNQTLQALLGSDIVEALEASRPAPIVPVIQMAKIPEAPLPQNGVPTMLAPPTEKPQNKELPPQPAPEDKPSPQRAPELPPMKPVTEPVTPKAPQQQLRRGAPRQE